MIQYTVWLHNSMFVLCNHTAFMIHIVFSVHHMFEYVLGYPQQCGHDTAWFPSVNFEYEHPVFWSQMKLCVRTALIIMHEPVSFHFSNIIIISNTLEKMFSLKFLNIYFSVWKEKRFCEMRTCTRTSDTSDLILCGLTIMWYMLEARLHLFFFFLFTK